MAHSKVECKTHAATFIRAVRSSSYLSISLAIFSVPRHVLNAIEESERASGKKGRTMIHRVITSFHLDIFIRYAILPFFFPIHSLLIESLVDSIRFGYRYGVQCGFGLVLAFILRCTTTGPD